MLFCENGYEEVLLNISGNRMLLQAGETNNDIFRGIDLVGGGLMKNEEEIKEFMKEFQQEALLHKNTPGSIRYIVWFEGIFRPRENPTLIGAKL